MSFPRCCGRPSPQRVARAAITDFTAFVADRTGRELPDYAGAVGVLDAGPGRLLVRDRRLLPGALAPAAHRGAARGGHARRGLVPRRHAELRRTRAGRPGRADRRPRPGGHRGRRGRHRAAAHPGAAHARRSAPRRPACGRSASGPGDRVVALVPNSVHALVGFLATAALGRGVVVLLPGFRRAVGDRPVHPDLPDGAARGRRLPLRRPGVPGRRHRAQDPGRRCRRWPAPCTFRRSAPRRRTA